MIVNFLALVRAPRRSLFLVVTFLMVVWLSGCGGAGASSDTVGKDRLPPENPWGLGPLEVSSFQMGLLEDGELSFGEYESAVRATVACLEGEGIWVSDVELDGDQFAYTFGGSASVDEQEVVEETYERCYSQYQSTVDLAWVVQNAPSEEESQAIRNEIAVCLRELGLEVGEDPSHEEIVRIVQAAGNDAYGCMQTY